MSCNALKNEIYEYESFLVMLLYDRIIIGEDEIQTPEAIDYRTRYLSKLEELRRAFLARIDCECVKSAVPKPKQVRPSTTEAQTQTQTEITTKTANSTVSTGSVSEKHFVVSLSDLKRNVTRADLTSPFVDAKQSVGIASSSHVHSNGDFPDGAPVGSKLKAEFKTIPSPLAWFTKALSI